MKSLPFYLIVFSMLSLGYMASYEPVFVPEGVEDGTAQIGTNFRWTKNGWEDSTIWEMNQSVPKSYLGAVHPLVWGVTTLILALIGLLWLTRESEVDHLIEELDQFLADPGSTVTVQKK